MKPRTPPPGFKRIHRDRKIHEVVHDSYQARSKPVEPAVCPDCGALFHKGGWKWLPAPAQAHRELCPACHRIRDKFPAGYVALDGEFLREHRDEVLQLLRSQRLLDLAPPVAPAFERNEVLPHRQVYPPSYRAWVRMRSWLLRWLRRLEGWIWGRKFPEI